MIFNILFTVIGYVVGVFGSAFLLLLVIFKDEM